MDKKYLTIIEYLALFTIFALGAYFYSFFRFNPYKQFLVVIAVSISYVIWGTLYHLIRVRLYWHIVYEYILIAVLVTLLFAFSLNIL